MARLILTIYCLFIAVFSYSQQEKKILSKALQSYNRELPKLEKQAFKELRKLDKSNRSPKSNEFKNYHFVVIPMFKLKDKYILYHKSDTDSFANYIDFEKIHDQFDVFVFRDSIYQGHLCVYDNASFYFSLNDTNKYNKPSFNGQYNLAKQIINFKPDIVFYPDCPMFLCFLKEGKLYIGRGAKQLQTLDYILPVNEFIEKNPLFIKELHDNKNPELKHYIELH